nr:hypothetical protein [Tanacetum cinerariifolium]
AQHRGVVSGRTEFRRAGHPQDSPDGRRTTAGLKRLNVSLDSLDPARFRELTRTGDLNKVIAGLDAAWDAGFRNTKLNCVVMKGRNDHE